MTATVTKQNFVNWIIAALLAFTLFATPMMTETASADCSITCVSTTGDEECTEWVGIEGELAVCTNSGS